MKEEAKARAEQIISAHFRTTELRPYGQLIREIAGSLEAAYNVGFFEGRQVGLRQGREQGYIERFFDETQNDMELKFDNQVTVMIEGPIRQKFINYRYPTFEGHLRYGNLLWKIMNDVEIEVNIEGKMEAITLLEAYRTFEGTRRPKVSMIGFHLHKPVDFITSTEDPDWPKYVKDHTEDEPNDGPTKDPNDDQKS